MSPNVKVEPYYFVGVLKKAAEIVEAIAERGEISVAELVSYLGQDRNAVNRIVLTLQDLGYVERLDNKKYRLTLKMFQLGSRSVSSGSVYRLINKHMKVLVDEFGETVCLGQRHGTEVVNVDMLSGHRPILYTAHIGASGPLQATAMGKCILAAMNDEELHTAMATLSFKPHTPKSITSREKLSEEIQKVRRDGYSTDDEEWMTGVRCVGIAVYSPSGQCDQAISISGPAITFVGKRLETISQRMLEVRNSLIEAMNINLK
ncbi:IclR family transcriptional regulator [Deltaproteobacteria bacterium OttesenSCG-928-M10]|nr:IclR family transcriptional regulator [Deltaproteobacteria bacterium OttesenSCG-928-M10]